MGMNGLLRLSECARQAEDNICHPIKYMHIYSCLGSLRCIHDHFEKPVAITSITKQCIVSQVHEKDCSFVKLEYPQLLLVIHGAQKMFRRKRFGSNNEVISKTGTYFGHLDRLLYTDGINKVESNVVILSL